jgi:hypothetical protein
LGGRDGRIGKKFIACEDSAARSCRRHLLLWQSSRLDSDNTETNLLKAAKYCPITGLNAREMFHQKENHLFLLVEGFFRVQSVFSVRWRQYSLVFGATIFPILPVA